MINRMVLCLAASAIIFLQACGTYEDITDDIWEQATLVGDPDTKVKSADNKFLCDSDWTPGPKEWSYTGISGGNPVDEKDKSINEPWCLLPYGNSTAFTFSRKSGGNGGHYICRDLNAKYSFKDEALVDTKNIYEAHTQMMCVPMGEIFVSAEKNISDSHQNEKLYHVQNMENRFVIVGHFNLKLVKPVKLNVLFEVFRNSSLGREDLLLYEVIQKDSTEMIKEWKNYMSKVGYELDITFIPIPIPFQDINERVKDNMLTIPYGSYTADESIDINKSLGANQYDYVIGVTPRSTYNTVSTDVFSLNIGNGFILTDNNFFGKDLGAKTKSRALSSLLYSKILGKHPLEYHNTDKSSWLSVYPFFTFFPVKDVDIFTQPSADWELGRSSPILFKYQLEFASIMQYFKGE